MTDTEQKLVENNQDSTDQKNNEPISPYQKPLKDQPLDKHRSYILTNSKMSYEDIIKQKQQEENELVNSFQDLKLKTKSQECQIEHQAHSITQIDHKKEKKLKKDQELDDEYQNFSVKYFKNIALPNSTDKNEEKTKKKSTQKDKSPFKVDSSLKSPVRQLTYTRDRPIYVPRSPQLQESNKEEQDLSPQRSTSNNISSNEKSEKRKQFENYDYSQILSNSSRRSNKYNYQFEDISYNVKLYQNQQLDQDHKEERLARTSINYTEQSPTIDQKTTFKDEQPQEQKILKMEFDSPSNSRQLKGNINYHRQYLQNQVTYNANLSDKLSQEMNQDINDDITQNGYFQNLPKKLQDQYIQRIQDQKASPMKNSDDKQNDNEEQQEEKIVKIETITQIQQEDDNQLETITQIKQEDDNQLEQ